MKKKQARQATSNPDRPEGPKEKFDASKGHLNAKFAGQNDVYYMGLDISSFSTGYAVLDAGGKLKSFGVIRSIGDVPARLQNTRNEIAVILNKYKPTFVAIEDMISMKYGRTAKILNYFNGVAYLTCFDFSGNDVFFIASSSMKAAIGVNSRALKKEGFDRDGIKEIIYNKICDIFKFKIPVENDNYKYRHDIADAANCALKLYQIINENKNEAKN